MAGSYPNVPGRRMAWDADGTVVTQVTTGDTWAGPITAGVAIGPTTRAELNDEDLAPITLTELDSKHGWLTFIFPELREVDGLSVGLSATTLGNHYIAAEDSTDTVDGIGGTWGTASADVHGAAHPNTLEGYRDSIVSLARAGKRAVRLQRDLVSGQGGGVTCFVHIYGEISPGETPDRILWIDENTGVEFTAAVDFGDVPRGGSEDRQVRLRNNSASLTANNLQYTAESLYQLSGAWYTWTLPGAGVFQGTQQVASLAPATTTGIITLRRITPGTEVLNLHAARALVSVGSWT